MKSLYDFLNKKTINILYIYGWKNYDGASHTSSYFSNHLSDKFNVYCETYDQKDPTHGFSQITKFIDDKDIDLVIGCSLGAFFALKLKNVPKIIINPTTKPSSILGNLGATKDIVEKYKSFEKDVFDNIDAEERMITFGLFGKNDDIVNDKDIFDKHYNYSKIIDCGHKLSESDVKDIVIPFIYSDVLTKRQSRIVKEDCCCQVYDMITERFVNLLKKDQMETYKDQVWDILQTSYSYIGGMAGMRDVDQLIEESDFWKLVRRSGKITAVCVYSYKRGGRKSCYVGCDQTEQGKADLSKMLSEDAKLTDREQWGEYSGRMVSVELKNGAMPIPSSVAKEVMKDKKFLEFKDDGYFYVRMIGGDPHTKIMMGNYKGIRNECPEEVLQKVKELAKKYSEEDEKNNG